MKNFTRLTAIVLFVFAISFSSSVNAQSGTGGGNGNGNNGTGNGNGGPIGTILTGLLQMFNTTPQLVSGTALQPGAKYKYSSIVNGVTAYVTIVSATGGATCTNIDDNTLTKPEAFSPVISIPAHSNGLVTFKFEYFQGTSNNNYTAASIVATAMDIDGNSTLHEKDVLDMGAGSTAAYVMPTAELSMTQNGTEWTGLNIGGVEYNQVDTMAKQVMFTVSNTNISSFIYKAGANNTGNSSVSRQKGIYFKGFNYAISSLLPVKYASFTAAVKEKSVLLNWITEEEINNDHYEVERSYTGNDFTQIGIVLDGFENGTQKNYSFRDSDPALFNHAVAYYRLRQVDKDGRGTYSNVVTVRLKGNADVAMQVSPNPFVEKLNVQFSSEEKGNAEIRIISIAGQSMITRTATVNKGINNISVNGLSTLSAGTYAAILTMDGKVIANQKIIK